MDDTARLLQEIRALEEKLHRPDIRASREATSELLADGFVEFGSSGAVYRRDEIIELLAQENNGTGRPLAVDYALRAISANAVLLTYRTIRSSDGGPERHVLRSSLWQNIDNRWQMVFHQGTPTIPEF